jgi:hypothetical protein
MRAEENPADVATESDRLRMFKAVQDQRREVVLLMSQERSIPLMKNREKRLQRDIDEALELKEYVGAVEDLVAHVQRTVERHSIDEDALLALRRATVIDDERAKRRVPLSDPHATKAILNCPAMKKITADSQRPEVAMLKQLIGNHRRLRETHFADTVSCRLRWSDVEAEAGEVLAVAAKTAQSRLARREAAEEAYDRVRAAQAEKAWEALH